jgi:hypothetical protein
MQSNTLLPLTLQGLFVPPVPQGALWALLDQSINGRSLMHILQKSMLDIVNDHFNHDKVKILLLKCAAELLIGLRLGHPSDSAICVGRSPRRGDRGPPRHRQRTRSLAQDVRRCLASRRRARRRQAVARNTNSLVSGQGLWEVYLGTTEKFFAAHRFYEKNGFREIAQTKLPASFPIMTVDTKFYSRSL